MPAQREVILNVNVLDVGFHPSAWRAPDLHPTSFIDPDYYTEVAKIAERGTLDALFLADGPALREDPAVKPTRALEPTTVLGVVASATEHLGLIGTASTTFNDPFDLADRFLSLDVVSGGRVAWNVVTTFHAGTAHNFGLSRIPDRESRYRRATEFVDVVTALWESATTRVPVHHDGEYFHVHGALPVPPSPQGHPLLVQAGGSPQGRALAGRSADAVFSAELTLDAGRQHYRDVKDVARAAGRDPQAVKILPGLVTVVGSTETEAIARYEDWESKTADGFSAERLGGMLGVDLSSLDPDRPIPQELLLAPVDPSFSGSLGFREAVVRLALESRYSVTELLRKAGGFGHRLVVGSPEQIADTIEEWFLARAADGFNLMPDGFPSGLTDFVDHVVPILRAKGIFRYEYAESTLRERFEGAPLPVSG
ncbi:LLM class flavin-dependent oxidoreductase [Rhodococcus sp. JVH1]|uniref:LLM class flavin-dependent oxidoreductase n=1 Tax=Rhodococcus sp. JVH1 TaxID=745408 RepID=UPI0002720D48|nr:LLM class flavin-dependent oxidoreductase [Rhodococcus sp. JVH1]EJJ00267.1 nitrilotriacetate monooxygenase component A [Rhodococcus sp. JVH1]